MSAFDGCIRRDVFDEQSRKVLSVAFVDSKLKFQQPETESEDEEVTMICESGIAGIDESDMNTSADCGDGFSDSDSVDGDMDDTEPSQESGKGVVNFLATPFLFHACEHLFRPRASSPRLSRKLEDANDDGSFDSRLGKSDESSESIVNEEDDIEDDDGSQSSSGARGIRLSIGTPSAVSEASTDESDRDKDVQETEEESMAVFASDTEQSTLLSPGGLAMHLVNSAPDADAQYLADESEEESVDEGRAGAIKEQNDEELCRILSLINDSKMDSESDRSGDGQYIGVMKDRDDIDTAPKTKRVLSFGALAALNSDDRSRTSKRLCGCSAPFPGSFALGPPVFSEVDMCFMGEPRGSPLISNSSEDDALDCQLGLELSGDEDGVDDYSGESTQRECTPVPLLTPPGSPLTIQVNGSITSICEWPSNLVVDCAMAAASELRPLSPESLDRIEQEERHFEDVGFIGIDRRSMPKATGLILGSALTPLLRSIYVEPMTYPGFECLPSH